MIVEARTGNFLGFAACGAMMAYALYAQEMLVLDPCPLCILQRIAVIAMGVVFLLAALQNPGRTGLRVYGGLLAATAVAGAGVAGRHVYLQNLPPDKVPACGPGLEFMLDTFPLREVIEMVLTGSGECAEVKWSLLGLSMPAWVLIAVLFVGGLGVWLNWNGRLMIPPQRTAAIRSRP